MTEIFKVRFPNGKNLKDTKKRQLRHADLVTRKHLFGVLFISSLGVTLFLILALLGFLFINREWLFIFAVPAALSGGFAVYSLIGYLLCRLKLSKT